MTGAETMLRKAGESDQVTAVTGRIVAFDRARTFVTLLVVIHHSVVNFTHFGNGDRMRWLGFDLIVLFNDSFFMAFMFLISGLFVHDSLTRHGAGGFLRRRAWRLGMPLLLSIFVLIPIAYYASFLRYHMPGTTDFNYFHYWGRMITTGPWPSGQSWFLWVLLVFNVIAAAIWITAPKILAAFGYLIGALRSRPAMAFAALSSSRSCPICRCISGSATAPGSSRATTRFRFKPAASCSIRPISSPVSASASSA
jgi:hypothetical protein